MINSINYFFIMNFRKSIELLKNFIVQLNNKIDLIDSFYKTEMDKELIFQQLLYINPGRT
ncbi:hypothetical protein LEP1GSC021_2458 [Leptospira noguchii str. 1993005606]|nr:hypothetical protein LEP1GSC021_2458 [Leptospira noguchii str. 1993005606]